MTEPQGARPNHAPRSRGRMLALQLLYSFEQNHYQDDGRLVPDEEMQDADDEVRAYARRLFDGFRAERAAVDEVVDQRLDNWSIQRLAVLDRSILRLGAYELIYCAEVPPKVAINEYIELSKQFGSEARTAKLVNGVLDRIAREHRAGEVARRGPESA